MGSEYGMYFALATSQTACNALNASSLLANVVVAQPFSIFGSGGDSPFGIPFNQGLALTCSNDGLSFVYNLWSSKLRLLALPSRYRWNVWCLSFFLMYCSQDETRQSFPRLVCDWRMACLHSDWYSPWLRILGTGKRLLLQIYLRLIARLNSCARAILGASDIRLDTVLECIFHYILRISNYINFNGCQ